MSRADRLLSTTNEAHNDRFPPVSELFKIDCHAAVPPIAKCITVSYQFESEICGAQIFRTLDDAHPIVLDQQHGEITFSVVDPSFLYYRLLDGSSPLQLGVIGYELH